MKQLIWIRHPQSEANEQGYITEHPHVQLSSFWWKTAQQFVQHYPFGDTARSLLLTGTQERSQILADLMSNKYNRITIETTPLLNERDFWIFGWLTKSELVQQLQIIYAKQLQDLFWNKKDYHKMSTWMDKELNIPWWFESNYKVQQRIISVIVQYIYQQPYDTIYIIASNGMIRNAIALSYQAQMWDIVSGLEIDDLLPNNKIPNLSQTIMTYDDQKDILYPPSKIAYLSEELQHLFQWK